MLIYITICNGSHNTFKNITLRTPSLLTKGPKCQPRIYKLNVYACACSKVCKVYMQVRIVFIGESSRLSNLCFVFIALHVVLHFAFRQRQITLVGGRRQINANIVNFADAHTDELSPLVSEIRSPSTYVLPSREVYEFKPCSL